MTGYQVFKSTLSNVVHPTYSEQGAVEQFGVQSVVWPECQKSMEKKNVNTPKVENFKLY